MIIINVLLTTERSVQTYLLVGAVKTWILLKRREYQSCLKWLSYGTNGRSSPKSDNTIRLSAITYYNVFLKRSFPGKPQKLQRLRP